jgi:probable rRNA maturation factor
MTMEIDVQVHLDEGAGLPVTTPEVEHAVRAVLAAEGVAEAEVSVAVVSDGEIARLNQEYLSHEGPTDVITFPLHRPGGAPLGDIYIGGEQARRQAADAGVPLREEILRLAIHGTLHVLGYDHPEGSERAGSPMYLRQEELLARTLTPPGQ